MRVESKLQRKLLYAVRQEISRRKWTQVQLADRSGVSPETIQRILSGKSQGMIDSWDRILKTLGLDTTIYRK